MRALQVGNAITHMEGFIDASGPAGFIDATLRPAGAYRSNVRLCLRRRSLSRMGQGCVDGLRWTTGGTASIFRGPGSGSVEIVDGIDTIQHELQSLIVESRWPKIRGPKSATYTGDGFVTLRHPDVTVVQNALDFIDKTVRITYSSLRPSEPSAGCSTELNKPAWDVEAVQ